MIDPIDETTALSRRRRTPADELAEHTVVSSRRSGSPVADVEATVLSSGTAPADRPVDETLLRSTVATTGSERAAAPADADGAPEVPRRSAMVPDAATLRQPTPPRPAPLVASRPERAVPSSGSAVPVDREGMERRTRARARRRIIALALSAVALLAASLVTLALVLA